MKYKKKNDKLYQNNFDGSQDNYAEKLNLKILDSVWFHLHVFLKKSYRDEEQISGFRG